MGRPVNRLGRPVNRLRLPRERSFEQMSGVSGDGICSTPRYQRIKKAVIKLRLKTALCDSGNYLLSHLAALSSALKTLTIEFGMGSGVCNQVWSPENSLRVSVDTRRDYSNMAETEE